jgi:SAM-dependent methyltransferase
MFEFVANHLLVLLQVFLGLSLLLAAWVYLPVPWGAPWIPSSAGTVRKMLQIAEVNPGDLVLDLGAGDGRVVILAAKAFGARGMGVEIDPLRCLIANAAIAVLGLRKRAHVFHGNMFSFDTSAADVVVLYLLQGTNQRIKEKLQRELRPGARVVSHTFSMSDWTPTVLDDRRGIFLYEIGRTSGDVWTEFL